MSTSALYEGTIRHRRFAVRGNEFSHRITMAYAELDESAAAPIRALASSSGPVRQLTLPRRFGKAFNPAGFYYCFDSDEQLQAVIVEVTSTPWGERHRYVLARSGSGPVLHGEFAKRMHVSPFMGMEQTYSFRAATPGPTLAVHIESSEHGAVAFDATLNLRRVPAGRRARTTTPWRVLALIYGHALGLKLKGVPVHPHPEVPAA